MQEDRVDTIVREWRVRRPDLDVTPVEVVARLLRAAHHLQTRMDTTAAAYGLSHRGDLDVLTDLYRAGPPYERTPTALAEALLITAGGMTVRLNRLERSGLARRSPNPRDRRGVLVALTPAGVDIAEHALARSLQQEAEMLRALDASEAQALATTLRTLLVALGDTPPFRPEVTAPPPP